LQAIFIHCKKRYSYAYSQRFVFGTSIAYEKHSDGSVRAQVNGAMGYIHNDTFYPLGTPYDKHARNASSPHQTYTQAAESVTAEAYSAEALAKIQEAYPDFSANLARFRSLPRNSVERHALGVLLVKQIDRSTRNIKNMSTLERANILGISQSTYSSSYH